jgi:ATP-binding cassette subfamily B protein RaxB
MSNPVEHLQYSSKKKMSLIRKNFADESGIACFAMIASYYDIAIDVSQLRSEKFKTSRRKSFKQLIALADKIGFNCNITKLDLDNIKQLKLPCILAWGEGNFVVLEEVRGKDVTIYDPEIGICDYSMSNMLEKFNGSVIELNPVTDYKHVIASPKASLSSFWTHMTGFKKTLMKIFHLSVLLQIFIIASPLYMQMVMDDVLVSNDYELLTILSVGFLLILLLQVICTALRSMIISIMGNQLSIQMSANLIRHLFKLPMDYFENRHLGDILSRISSLEQIRILLTTTIVESIVDGLIVIALLVVMSIYSAKLTLVVVGISLVYLVVRLYLFGRFREIEKRIITCQAEKETNLMESVRGIQSIKLFNQEIDRLNIFNNLNVKVSNYFIKGERLRINFVSWSELLYGLETITVTYMAAHLVMSGNFSIGMIFAFMAYRQQFSQKAVNLIDKLIEFKMISLHLERLGDISLTEQEAHLGTLDEKTELGGRLELKSISFRYPDNDDFTLKNVNIQIEKGESVAIIGPSGCGKSTLLKIMLGLLHPNSGEIIADNKSIYQIGLCNYRGQVASVMQNEQLMSGTIFENICFFDSHPDGDLIIECAEKSGIHDDILSLNGGYQSVIGDMGNSLSGGQLQRLILARALYSQPSILFLDEATSNLDISLENYINNSIKSLAMTRVFIAHRPQTIKSADRIFKFENGNFLEINAKEYDPKEFQ